MDKTEWPTETRLEELRQQGRVAYSPFATRSLAAVGAIASTLFVSQRINEFLNIFTQLVQEKRSIEALVSYSWSAIIPIGLGVVCAVLFITLAAGLFQTKVLFLSENLRFNLSRLNRFRLPSVFAAFGRMIQIVFLVVSAALVGIIALYLGLRPVLEWLHQSPDKFLTRVGDNLMSLALPLLVVLLASTILFWLMGKWRFAMANRMSREEVENESYD